MWVQSDNGPWLQTALLSEGWGKVVVLKDNSEGKSFRWCTKKNGLILDYIVTQRQV